MLSRRVMLKAPIALLVGLPGTVMFLPLIAMGVAGGIYSIGQAMSSEGGSPIAQVFLEAAPVVAWGLAGLVGLIGFWAWIFASSGISGKARSAIAVCVLTGVIAVAPFLFFGSVMHTTVAALGVLLGLAICLWLKLPNLPLNPDARHRPRAG